MAIQHNTATHSLHPQAGKDILPKLICSRRRIVTLIGGGGKTSLMYRVARYLQETGCSVITTTTTKLSATARPGVETIPLSSLDDARGLLAKPNTSKLIRTLHAVRLTANKLAGIPALWIDKLAQEFPQIYFLVEGDGSAGLSLKGHLPHEPVIPDSTTLLIPVIGLDALGKPLSAAHVHRPELFRQITGASQEAKITSIEVLAALLNDSGYLSRSPRGATILPFLNKAETPELWDLGYDLALQLLVSKHPGLEAVLLGSVHHNRFLVLP